MKRPIAASPAGMHGMVPLRRRPRRTIYDHWFVDLLFAIAIVALFTGFDFYLGDQKVAPTSFVAPIILVIYLPKLLKWKPWPTLLIVPLVAFLAIHLISAVSNSLGTGMIKLIQVGVVLSILWPFVIRYSERSMGTFYKFFVALTLTVMVVSIIWHIANGHYVSWKRLDEPKTTFVLLPLFCVAFALSKTAAARRYGFIAFAVATVLILLSGERKAYILLVMSLPMVLSFRNPFTYLAPLAFAGLVLGAAVVDSTGYVERQVNTLSAFSQGRMVQSISNNARARSNEAAMVLYKQNPVFGVGTNGYLIHGGISQAELEAGLGIHGEFLRIGAENGTVGLVAFSSIILVAAYNVFRRRRPGRVVSPDEWKIGVLLLSTCIVYVSLEAFDTLTLLVTCIMAYIYLLRLDPVSEATRLSQRRAPVAWQGNGARLAPRPRPTMVGGRR